MPYIPHTKDDIKTMLQSIGKNSVEDLFNSIPAKYRLKKGALNIKEGLSEYDAKQKVEKLASDNVTYPANRCFLGAGAYYHFIPSVVNHIVSRSEFYTAYTPYQPEISQGTLQSIFEFQTMMCRLTGMDVSNASMYDGATALAESVLVAYKYKREKKKSVVVPSNIHPEYIEVLKNYLTPFGIKIILTPFDAKTGEVDINSIKNNSTDLLAVIVQSPNYYGVIESNASKIASLTKELDAVPINLVIETTSLGLFKSPRELGFDIAVLEIQSLGNPVAFGGPHCGVITATKDYIRNLPGRIIGETKDIEGNRAFVLTLATREQHIRREKATSNICSNQALVALRTAIYLSVTGENGYKELARTNYTLSHYTKDQLEKSGAKIKYKGDFYNEFVVEFSSKELREKLYNGLKSSGFLPGYKIGDKDLLITVTEVNSKTSIDEYLATGRRYAN